MSFDIKFARQGFENACLKHETYSITVYRCTDFLSSKWPKGRHKIQDVLEFLRQEINSERLLKSVSFHGNMKLRVLAI